MSSSSGAEQKRCFECGATYPPEVLVCPNDGTPVCFDTVGRRWKIEGVLGRRLGGAIYSGFHLVSGQRAAIDLLPGENARDATALTLFQKQLQALRLLDRLLDSDKGIKSRVILKLIEEGTERDGSRFFVTELGKARLLKDLVDEWHQLDAQLMDPVDAAQLVRPLLSLLSTASRLGMAHGSIETTQIFVTSDSDFATGLVDVGTVMLHGMTLLGSGQPLREAQAADLGGLGRVLYELCTGTPAPSNDVLVAGPLPFGLAGPLGPVMLRAVGAPGHRPFGTAEEMQRALSAAVSPRGGVGTSSPENEPVAGPTSEVPVPKHLSLPPMPSGPGVDSGKNQRSFPPGASLPPVRVTAPHAILPSPLAPLSAPQRSGLTSELRQVSILDLINEQKEAAARQETLARSRFRPSLDNIKPLTLTPPSEAEAPAPPAPAPEVGEPAPTLAAAAIDSAAEPARPAPAPVVQQPAASFDLEGPTQVSASHPDMEPVAIEPAAAAAAPSATSARPAAVVVEPAAADAPPSASSKRSPPAGAAPGPQPAAADAPPFPIAADSDPPTAVDAPPLARSGITAGVSDELPRWVWFAVLGPLVVIILGLVIKLLSR